MTEALAIVAREGRFVRRGDAEDDPTHKQVIPYLVLRDGERWFLMRRTRGGGDARLHDLGSIGVGGHLNPGDVDVEGGLRREWREELVADFVPAFEPLGLLNDDTTPVGVGPRRRSSTPRMPPDDPCRSGRPTSSTGTFATTAEVAARRDDARDLEPARLRRPDRKPSPVKA